MKTDLFETSSAARSTMNGKPVFSVPSKSVINFDSGFKHKLLCDGLTFSLGSSCAYSCAFCYVPDMMRKLRDTGPYKHVTGAHEDIIMRRENGLAVLVKQLESAQGRRLASQRLTIYASPLVDVAANMDLVRETVEACKVILRVTCWDIRLLSKSTLLPEVARGLEPWSSFGPKERIIYGVSTGTLDDGLARAIEGGTPLVSKRLASLHWLQDHGYRTFGMICPSLPQSDYAAFSRDMAAAIRADRCEHVWAEVLNARGESFTRTLRGLVDAGHSSEANRFEDVSNDKAAWEQYARATFEAHAATLPVGKLRFLQYVSASNREWWESQVGRGAVLL